MPPQGSGNPPQEAGQRGGDPAAARPLRADARRARTVISPERIEAAFRLIEAAAAAGEPCPQNYPFGPIPSRAMAALCAAGRIRSEVYAHNWRRAVILDGPHKGKATASPPGGGKPYLVNGVHVGRGRRRTGKIAP